MLVVELGYHKGMSRSERGNVFANIQCFSLEFNIVGDLPKMAMTFSSSYSI